MNERLIQFRVFVLSLVVTSAGLTISCTENIFKSFSQENSDAALIFAAKAALDKKDYSTALTEIAKMTADGQIERETLVIKASAHGGLCAVEFLPFLSSIADQGSSTLMTTLMNTMTASTAAAQTNCTSGIDALRLISTTAASRTGDENMLMTVLSMGRIGSILNQNADDADNNGTVDGDFNHCTTISAANLNQIVVSFAETIQSLAAVGSSSVAAADMTTLTQACTDLAAADPDFDFCSNTNVAAVTAEQRQGMQGVIGSNQSIGLGTCVGDVPTCAATVPCDGDP